jgi:hypothetical protein
LSVVARGHLLLGGLPVEVGRRDAAPERAEVRECPPGRDGDREEERDPALAGVAAGFPSSRAASAI